MFLYQTQVEKSQQVFFSLFFSIVILSVILIFQHIKNKDSCEVKK